MQRVSGAKVRRWAAGVKGADAVVWTLVSRVRDACA